MKSSESIGSSFKTARPVILFILVVALLTLLASGMWSCHDHFWQMLAISVAVLGILAFWNQKLYYEIRRSKAAEAALRDTEIRYRLLFEYSPDGIVILDPDTARPIEFNETACRQLGYSREEFARLSVSDFEIIETSEETRARIAKVIRAGRDDFETRHRTKQGEIRNIHVTAQTIEIMGRLVYHCVWRDITERKNMEQSLRGSEEKYRSIVDNIGIGVALISPYMEILSINSQMKKWNPHIDPKHTHICYRAFNNPPRDSICIYCPTVKTLKDGLVHEDITETPMNGQVFNYRIISSPVKDEAGKVIAAIEMVEDITERKKAQEKISESLKEEIRSRQIVISMLEDNNQVRERLENSLKKIQETQAQLVNAEKMKAVGTMASGIAHEVKNPLGIILLGVNYFEGILPPEQADNRKMLQMMKESVERADSIVCALLDFSRAPALKPEKQEINAIINTSLELVQHKLKLHSVEITCELGKELPKLFADKGKIEQVFVNLLNNAADAMPKGGKLYVRSYLSRLEASENKVGNREEDFFRPGEEAIIVEVEDSGTGIDGNVIDKIFDPFFTTKNRTEGTGLGLSIIKNIIEMHKGLISVESKKGQGTKFTIVFKV
ncbi:MAG: PAS domain S-box protein [Candidatus Omnitrophica bacterium]|nr:PAS domain S-box protein [Candidatus Omnitrophota bacterium]